MRKRKRPTVSGMGLSVPIIKKTEVIFIFVGMCMDKKDVVSETIDLDKMVRVPRLDHFTHIVRGMYNSSM